jgi:hypothetical protein
MKIKDFIILFILLIAQFSGCIEEQKSVPKQKTPSEIATEFMTFLFENNYEGAYDYFNATVKQQFTIVQFKGTWEYYTNTYGEFELIREIWTSIESGFDIVRINTTFSLGYVITFKLVFNASQEISGFWTENIESISSYVPPGYVNTSGFIEYEVTIGTGAWKIPGTITVPKGETTYPSIVLVHGSGPNDRDETIGPNKPFKDIAWGLASQDIIVLRYDKRTLVYPEETAVDKNLTVKEEVVDDAIQAVHFLKNHTNVDKNQIYVLGHSLGAMMAPQIATLNNNITGIILLATPARNLEDLIYNQTVYLSNLDGIVDKNETEIINTIEDAIEKIRSLNISENEKVLSTYKKYWEYITQYDQVKTAESLTIPILLLQGKRDYQVTFEDDFAVWNDTLSDNKRVDLKTYSSLNHLFISGEGVPTNTEYLVPGQVSEDVILDISHWIKGDS